MGGKFYSYVMEKVDITAMLAQRHGAEPNADDNFLQTAHSHILGSSTRPKSPARSQQRERTRAKIINAAILAFQEQRFHYATVDDITSRADISRATFYTHFRGKEEVLLDIIIQKHSTKHLSFRPLLEAEHIDAAFLSDWLKNSFLPPFVNDRDWLFSYYVVCDLYVNMANFFSDGRDEIIDMLGRRFGAFRCKDETGQADDARRARGHLELYKLEQFGLHAVHPGLSLPQDVFATEVVRGFLSFLNTDHIEAPTTVA